MIDYRPMFYCTEIVAYKPGNTTLSWEPVWGGAPWGALSQTVDSLASTTALYASDKGYRTLASDPQGVMSYYPNLSQAFAIDRRVNLSPNASGVAAAWGALTLANVNGQYNSIAAAWNSDGRAVKVLFGRKTREDFVGYRSTRLAAANYFDSTVTMQSAAAGVARTDWSTGSPVTLQEAAGTNYIRNPRGEGAIAGTPGTVPTYWGPYAGSGLSYAVVGTGTEGGIPYTDIRWSGTTTAYTIGAVDLDTFFSFPAVLGDTCTFSVFLRLVGGSLAGVDSTIIQMFEINSGGAALQQYNGSVGPATSAMLSTQRYFETHTVVNATCVSVLNRITTNIPASRTVDFTLRIGAPQAEKTSAPTSVMLPAVGTPAVSTRPAEAFYTARGIDIDPPYAALAPAFVGVATPWFLSETGLEVPVRDATYWLDRPLQTTQYQGTGGYEGTAALTGQPKPKARGGTAGYPISNVTPILIDPTNRIYQYSDGPGTVVRLYEGGYVSMTAGADTGNLYAGTTAAGTYRTDNSRGLFQLGGAPQYAITVDITGAFPFAGVQTVAATIARYLLTEDLQLPAANIDLVSFAAVAAAFPYVAGIYFDAASSPSGAEAVARVIGAFAAKLIPTRTGTLRLWALRALPTTAVASTALDTSNIVTLTPRALPSTIDPPAYRWRVSYGYNWTVQASGLSPSATAAHVQYVATANTYGAWASGAVGTAYVRPNDPPPIGGALMLVADAVSVAGDMGALWSTRRRQYDVTVPVAVGIGIDIGDTVSVRFPVDNLAAGLLGQVVGDQFRSQDATITFQVIV